jgi:hypothetical protein
VDPVALFMRVGEDLAWRGPEPKRPIAYGWDRARMPRQAQSRNKSAMSFQERFLRLGQIDPVHCLA